MKPGLTVIIPVLNEADILEDNTRLLVGYLERLGRPFEVIIVSNGSTDGTEALGRRLAGQFKTVRFLTLPEKGVGRAFALGVREAGFDLIVSLDMDLSIDLGFIPRAADLLDDYQIVVGSKKMGSQARTFWRKAGSTAFILTARALLGLSFKDYSIAAKAYHREVLLRYLDRIDHGTSYVLDIIYHTLAHGGRALEIPVHCEDFRASKFNLLREALYRFHHLFRLWWQYRLRQPPPRPQEPAR
ncbi:MAG: glycosyltransferase family 2 protein [Thermodesulfobacteriota bacterium]